MGFVSWACGVFDPSQLAVKMNSVFNLLDFSKEDVDAAVLRERLPRAAL
ncbi:histidinol dehydrogenase, partial [Mobiluncus curtisii]|nr:histidinol dehydrogenase [Mobiluncus curtisii]